MCIKYSTQHMWSYLHLCQLTFYYISWNFPPIQQHTVFVVWCKLKGLNNKFILLDIRFRIYLAAQWNSFGPGFKSPAGVFLHPCICLGFLWVLQLPHFLPQSKNISEPLICKLSSDVSVGMCIVGCPLCLSWAGNLPEYLITFSYLCCIFKYLILRSD